jgi:aspartate aminotransferase-like enzyme
VASQARFWAPDVTVNAPNNQVVRLAEVLERIKQQTGLQYSSFERHREATVVRRNCVVTMGYEIVVPKENVPNSGKTIKRRYASIYYLEEGGWRVIARQATNISLQ